MLKRILKSWVSLSLFLVVCLSNIIVFAQTTGGSNSSGSLFNSIGAITSAMLSTLAPNESVNINGSNNNENGNALETATGMDLQMDAIGTPHPGLAAQPALFDS